MKKSFKFLAVAVLGVAGFCGLGLEARADVGSGGPQISQMDTDFPRSTAILAQVVPVPATVTAADAGLATADVGPVAPEAEILKAITGGKLGWVAAIFTWIGILRVVFKPGMAFVRAVIAATPSTKDDQVLDQVEHSPAMKTFYWLLDYLTSIKIGSQAPKKSV